MNAQCRKCYKTITNPAEWNGSFNGCKPCRNKYLKNLRNTNPAYKLKAKERYRDNAVHYRFADKQLTVPDNWDDYPKDLCEICADPLTLATLNIDHSHDSGLFRGVLCRRCNTGLGFFKDSPELMRGAADYLSRSESGT